MTPPLAEDPRTKVKKEKGKKMKFEKNIQYTIHINLHIYENILEK